MELLNKINNTRLEGDTIDAARAYLILRNGSLGTTGEEVENIERLFGIEERLASIVIFQLEIDGKIKCKSAIDGLLDLWANKQITQSPLYTMAGLQDSVVKVDNTNGKFEFAVPSH